MNAAVKKKVTFKEYDTAEVINDKEDVIVFLMAALADNNPEYLLKTIGAITRSKGMTKIAK